MDAKTLSGMILVKKAAVFGEKTSVLGIDPDSAKEIKEIIDVLVPAERYDGYIKINDEYVIFRKDEKMTVLAFVEEERTRWCLKRLREVLDAS
ncbi:hypothetical protein [Archaeoglobus neptunius]|uniref:hypothetical protein n=1 Tax=Archaeoglobus neptunius TaxID=2798580 RepID=UPI001927DBB9|nr:hypothetical protein [Archaeoglobus neptunius]